MEALRDQGVKTLYGKWLVRGSPRVLLLDLKAAAPYLEVWRREFEAKAEVSVPVDDDMANDAILFGYLSNWFFQEVSRAKPPSTPTSPFSYFLPPSLPPSFLALSLSRANTSCSGSDTGERSSSSARKQGPSSRSTTSGAAPWAASLPGTSSSPWPPSSPPTPPC